MIPNTLIKVRKLKSIQLVIPLFFFWFLTAGYSSDQTWARTKWVDDGDTIVLTDGKRVRYIGINAPEIAHGDQKEEPFGSEATAFNKKMVLVKKIRLEFDRERNDQYGRLLAYVFLEDGTFLNASMLQTGFAYYLYREPNLKYDQMLMQSQREAMTAQEGIWRNWKEEKRIYLANRKSRRFHLATCPLAKQINWQNRIYFATKWDAFWNGYAPAKKCIQEFWSYETRDQGIQIKELRQR